VVSVCALTAAADPKISLATRYRVDAVLDRLDLVQMFDRAKITELLDEYIAAFGSDHDRTAEILHNKIRRVANDYKKSRTLLRIAYLIIVADGVVTEAEQAEFDRLCRMLSIEPGAVESGLQTGPVGA
jgi:tellurite resistance protein TerB